AALGAEVGGNRRDQANRGVSGGGLNQMIFSIVQFHMSYAIRHISYEIWRMAYAPCFANLILLRRHSRYRTGCARSNTQSHSGEQPALNPCSPIFSTRKFADFIRPSRHRSGDIIRRLWLRLASMSVAISSVDFTVRSSERSSRSGNHVA